MPSNTTLLQQSLLKAHERQEVALVDLRHKVRQLRTEDDAKDRQLNLARRTVERLTQEKAALEAGSGEDGIGW